jgi:predicted RNA-binding Zn-ribbon protein involved in translation (DUF1610 family)
VSKPINARTIVAVTAVAAFLALLTLVLSITATGAATPACPTCGRQVTVTRERDSTDYFCKQCYKGWTGPARYDFSWWDAFDGWASPATN